MEISTFPPLRPFAPEQAWRRDPQSVRRRAAERCCTLTRMFQERPDLAGVHDRADFATELTLWSV